MNFVFLHPVMNNEKYLICKTKWPEGKFSFFKFPKQACKQDFSNVFVSVINKQKLQINEIWKLSSYVLNGNENKKFGNNLRGKWLILRTIIFPSILKIYRLLTPFLTKFLKMFSFFSGSIFLRNKKTKMEIKMSGSS